VEADTRNHRGRGSHRDQAPRVVAVLGPGGVGGLLAGALARAGTPVLVVARESTSATIGRDGLRVESVLLGDFLARPRAVARLEEPVDVLVVATKAAALPDALARISSPPRLVLPLLNGLDHLRVLRERFGEEAVVAGTIRVEADRPRPGVVVHTSRFLRVDMASRFEAMREPMEALAHTLSDAGIPARVGDSEAQVMWSKLVRLNALACTTSAFDLLLGEIRSTPQLRADLIATIEEGTAVARAEGASIDAEEPLGELAAAHDTLGSSMQRDIAAGREPELDAIPGAVLRAAARHGIACPTIERLVSMIATRAGVPAQVSRLRAVPRGRGARAGSVAEGEPRRCGARAGSVAEGGDDRDLPAAHGVDDLFLGRLSLLVVLAVAEHPEVAAHAAVALDRDARQDLLALLQAQPLHVVVGEADAPRGVRRVLPVVGRDRLGEALQVLGDLAVVSHRYRGE
jgi:2-dehydropantoate 2-reductase